MVLAMLPVVEFDSPNLMYCLGLDPLETQSPPLPPPTTVLNNAG